jgi:hypothetical protein
MKKMKKQQIIDLFNCNVRGHRPDTTTYNQAHDGKSGHWLERQMGVKANSSNSPDLLGFEMKNDTATKTTFGDWSASYYIFQKSSKFKISRKDFLRIFGKPNLEKNGRHSWSGEPCPNIQRVNAFGQQLIIDEFNNIHAKYYYSKDSRSLKSTIVPVDLQVEGLTIARWDAVKMKKKVEDKFNQMGWFKCKKDSTGAYTKIVFGAPINFEKWISLVKSGDVFFDSGMYDGNSRNYSHWRALNLLWDKLVISQH